MPVCDIPCCQITMYLCSICLLWKPNLITWDGMQHLEIKDFKAYLIPMTIAFKKISNQGYLRSVYWSVKIFSIFKNNYEKVHPVCTVFPDLKYLYSEWWKQNCLVVFLCSEKWSIKLSTNQRRPQVQLLRDLYLSNVPITILKSILFD